MQLTLCLADYSVDSSRLSKGRDKIRKLTGIDGLHWSPEPEKSLSTGPIEVGMGVQKGGWERP